MDITEFNNLDDLILTEKDLSFNSKDMSEDEINELCQQILENKELIKEFNMTNKWLKLTNGLEDEYID